MTAPPQKSKDPVTVSISDLPTIIYRNVIRRCILLLMDFCSGDERGGLRAIVRMGCLGEEGDGWEVVDIYCPVVLV